MSHVLDRPVWNALATRQASLAKGGTLARRFPSSIVPFAAARDQSAESLAALARLATPGDQMVLVEAETIAVPRNCMTTMTASVVQMITSGTFESVTDERIEPLREADAAEMLELAMLTKPGPFTLRAQALGPFWGIRAEGKLVAMAGERLKQDGFSEVSGVCTHPDHRGHGFGKLLSRFVAGLISARGETPYLHTYAANATAIALYESIGFGIRRTLNLAAIQPVETEVSA